MRFVKLNELMLTDDNVITKGHVLVNLADVRKIIKVRDSLGGHCSRLSYSGLTSEHDIWVKETPDLIAIAMTSQINLPKIIQANFAPQRKIESKVVFDQPEFVTNLGEKA